MRVSAARTDGTDTLVRALERADAELGPQLIETVLA